MDTRQIAEVLKNMALQLKRGSDKQKALGQKVQAVALEVEAASIHAKADGDDSSLPKRVGKPPTAKDLQRLIDEGR